MGLKQLKKNFYSDALAKLDVIGDLLFEVKAHSEQANTILADLALNSARKSIGDDFGLDILSKIDALGDLINSSIGVQKRGNIEILHATDAVRQVDSRINRSNAAVMQCLREQAVRQLLDLPRYQEEKRLLKYGFKVFSQNDEDGILQEIFKRIGTANKTFVEFGVADGLENNSLYLLHKGWQGLWMEADPEQYKRICKNIAFFIEDTQRLRVENIKVNAENINDILRANDVAGEIDLFHIDIDGIDIYVYKAIDNLNPRVVMVEYNAHFPPDIDWAMGYDADYSWEASTYYGASLLAWDKVLSKQGYSLVGCNITGNNAFYVRNNLLEDYFALPYTPENHFEPMRYWMHLGYQPDLNFMPKVGPFISSEDIPKRTDT